MIENVYLKKRKRRKMASNPEYRTFLIEEVPKRLTKLKEDTPAKFGIMTPQHMVEHLILTAKICTKRYGTPSDPPSVGQQKFKRFIQEGANFEHRPGKTSADLPKLKYASLKEAIDSYPEGVGRFYNHFEANKEFLCYNEIQGELNYEELELLHYKHFAYHLDQFGI
ncbi:MAG: DUF1569 domain-containing protein [Bacteroidia bacterium]|nr:DUF1569 domain-containing protein [Bacteroidia bacterium]